MAAAPDDGDRLLHQGAAALRSDHDPRRALGLLDEYLRRYPDGQLSAEALALSIEAAASLGDRRAGALGARYLARYPDGRYREAARRAVERFGQ
jgi:hypothetical protein